MTEHKVVAPDIRSALKSVKEEFGEDALILGTRTRRVPREGSLRLQEEVEVTVVAAADHGGRRQPAAAPGTGPENCADLETEVARVEVIVEEIERQLASSEAATRHPLALPLRELGISPATWLAIAADHAEEVPPFEQADLSPALGRLAGFLPCVEAMALKDLRGHHALIGRPGAGRSVLARKLAATVAAEGCRVALVAFAPQHPGERIRLEADSGLQGYEAVLANDPQALLEAVEYLGGRDLVILDMPAFTRTQSALLHRVESLLGGAPLLRHLVVPADGHGIDAGGALAAAHYIAIARADLDDPLRLALDAGAAEAGMLSFIATGPGSEGSISLASPRVLLESIARGQEKADVAEAGGGR